MSLLQQAELQYRRGSLRSFKDHPSEVRVQKTAFHGILDQVKLTMGCSGDCKSGVYTSQGFLRSGTIRVLVVRMRTRMRRERKRKKKKRGRMTTAIVQPHVSNFG